MEGKRFTLNTQEFVSWIKGIFIAVSGPALLVVGQQLQSGAVVWHDVQVALMSALGAVIVNLVRLWGQGK